MSEAIETKGHGMLHVDVPIWKTIGKPETPEQWHKAILLPDDYEVESIERKEPSGSQPVLYEIFISHKDIPTNDPGNPYVDFPLPHVLPVYHMEHHENIRKKVLDRIEIWAWQCDQWKQVK